MKCPIMAILFLFHAPWVKLPLLRGDTEKKINLLDKIGEENRFALARYYAVVCDAFYEGTLYDFNKPKSASSHFLPPPPHPHTHTEKSGILLERWSYLLELKFWSSDKACVHFVTNMSELLPSVGFGVCNLLIFWSGDLFVYY